MFNVHQLWLKHISRSIVDSHLATGLVANGPHVRGSIAHDDSVWWQAQARDGALGLQVDFIVEVIGVVALVCSHLRVVRVEGHGQIELVAPIQDLELRY